MIMAANPYCQVPGCRELNFQSGYCTKHARELDWPNTYPGKQARAKQQREESHAEAQS